MSDEATQSALRQMAGQLGELTSTVRSLETNWRNQDEKASTGRAVLHTKIDELRSDFHDWKGKLEAVITDVAEMKPTVDEVRTAKQRAIGAFMVSRVLYAVGIAMTAGVTYVASNWIKISIK
jgi:hypothetical protein